MVMVILAWGQGFGAVLRRSRRRGGLTAGGLPDVAGGMGGDGVAVGKTPRRDGSTTIVMRVLEFGDVAKGRVTEPAFESATSGRTRSCARVGRIAMERRWSTA